MQSLPFQFNHNNLRRIIDPEWDNAIAYSPADDHIGVLLNELACIILGKKALIGSHQATDKGQAELAAVGMAAEYQIDSGIDVQIKQLRPVGQQNCKAVRRIL